MPSLRCTRQLKYLVLNCYLRRVLFRFSFSQISTHFYLRNRKHFMCFRKVVQTSVWVSEKSYWEHGDFSWNLEKTRTHGFFKGQKIALVLRTRVIVRSLKKLTCACFFQLALETMLLPTQIRVLYIVYWMETQETFSTNHVRCCFNKTFFCMFFWRLCDAVTFEKLIGN